MFNLWYKHGVGKNWFKNLEYSLCITLNGLSKYCSKRKSIVNSVKTKFMVYGKLENVRLYFNGNALEQVTEYKYLGNIVKSVDRATSDIFAENYQ